MIPVWMKSDSPTYVNQANSSLAKPEQIKQATAPVQAEQTTVTLSDAAKQQLENEKKGKDVVAIKTEAPTDGKEEVAEKLESFTYGALGLDHPDEMKEEEDENYSAGQYLKGALTVGAILLAVV